MPQGTSELLGTSDLLPDEHPDLRQEAEKVWGENTSLWWEAPNAFLDGKPPRALAGTPEEWRVRELLRTIIHVGVS